MTTTASSGDREQPFSTPAVVIVLVPIIAVLHLAGPEPWGGWSEGSASVQLGFSVVRVLALVVAYHLLAMQVLAAIGRTIDRPRIEGFAHRFTPPSLRAGAGRLAGAGLAAATTVAMPTATAASDPPPTTATVRVVEVTPNTATITVVSSPEAPTGSDDPSPASTGTVVLAVEEPSEDPAPDRPAADLGPRSVQDEHVVRAGDHLWSIAESVVRSELGDAEEPPGEEAVARYWHQLVLTNPQLEDPDLLFQGDVITLPPLSHTG